MEKTNKLIVGIITSSYPPNKNGVAGAVYNLEQALLNVGVEVYIATPKILYAKYESNVFPIKSTGLPKKTTSDIRYPTDLLGKLSVTKFFKDKKVQIIHSHDTMIGGLEAVLIGNSLQIPVLHTYHTLIEDYEYFKFPGYKGFIRSYSQIVCDSSDGVIALCDKINKYLVNINVSSKIIPLPNIVNQNLKLEAENSKENSKKSVETFKKTRNFIDKILKIEKKLGKKPFIYISFGRLAVEKNIIQSINILEKTLLNSENVFFIIAGCGPLKNNLDEEVQKKGLENKILFYGEYNQGELKELCSFCDVFIITSFTEVLPTTPLEAMVRGLPVLCVNDSSYDYIVKDGFNGVKGDVSVLKTLCLDLHLDSKLVIEMGKNAKETAKHYLGIDFTEKYINCYQDFIQNYTPNPIIKKLFIQSMANSISQFAKVNTIISNKLKNTRI